MRFLETLSLLGQTKAVENKSCAATRAATADSSRSLIAEQFDHNYETQPWEEVAGDAPVAAQLLFSTALPQK